MLTLSASSTLAWLPLALAALTGAALAAPPPAGRERQERRLAVSGALAAPVPELRVAAGVVTTLVFDAALDRDSVEVEGRVTRFRLVDVGERSLLLEPAQDLAPQEHLGLRVRFADGAFPDQASFVLVSQPEQVDREVHVERIPRSADSLAAELVEARARIERVEGELDAARARCQAAGLSGPILSGVLGRACQLSFPGFDANAWAMEGMVG